MNRHILLLVKRLFKFVTGTEFSYQLLGPLMAAQRFSSALLDFFDEQLISWNKEMECYKITSMSYNIVI